MDLTVEPLTLGLWPALEDLFGRAGASNGCWCMYWRIGPRYRDRPARPTGTTSGTWPPPDRRPGCSPSTATAAATPSDGPNSPREPAWHGWDTPATSSPS